MKKILVLLLMLSFGACTHQTEKKIEADAAQQPEATTQEAVDAGRLAIAKSHSLTLPQKEQLLDLFDTTRIKISEVRHREAQVKSSLFKNIAVGGFDDREIRVYRKKLIGFENEKLNIMFASLKETRKILGKDIQTNPDIPEILDFQRVHADIY